MKDERGSVSVVVAGLVAIAMVMAMAAADVVRVLAAAQTLALPDDVSPEDRASEYAERNDATLASCVCEPGSFEARVAVHIDVGDLRLFGSGRSVIARARAVVDLPTT